MLTIQPNLVNYNSKKLSFKGNDSASTGDLDDKFYQEKTHFYEQKAREFEKDMNQEHTPDFLKKFFKGCKIVSEAALEGWAVAWGASKGAKVVKSSVIAGVDSKLGKEASEILTPFGKAIKEKSSKFFKFIANTFKNIKESNFVTSITKRLAETKEKMNQNSIGKFFVKGFEYIGAGLKYIGGKIKNLANKIIEPFKNAKASEIYDKASKATSTTLGVGAGAAGAYNATMEPNKKEATKETTEETTEKTTEKTITDDFESSEIDEDVNNHLELLEDEE